MTRLALLELITRITHANVPIQVAELLTKRLGRKITHVKLSESQLAEAMTSFGIPVDYAKFLAQLDTVIKIGEEEKLNSVILDITGHEPTRFHDFVKRCVESGVWVKEQHADI
jgi:festuclavine dehydrogenase